MQSSSQVMQDAQERIDALKAEELRIEAEAKKQVRQQELAAQLKANQDQQKINRIIEDAKALLQQNAKDMVETLRKVEAMMLEARAIAKAYNDHTPGFLLDDSVTLFCKDPVEFLVESLQSLTIATKFNAPERAVKLVAQCAMSDGKTVQIRPGQVMIVCEREAERMIRKYYPPRWARE